MAETKQVIKVQMFTLSIILAIIIFFPALVSAQEVTDPTTTETAAETGPDVPPAESPYVYNEATGMWENDYYIWNPITQQTTPKGDVDYSYNPETGQWDTTEWVYNPATKKYEPNVNQSALPPADNTVNSDPDKIESATTTAGSDQLQSGGGEPVLKKLTATDSEDGSVLDIDASSDSSGIFDLFYNATISNQHNSTAVSGDATVEGNTTAGSATTGNASAIANFINSIASYWDGLGGNLFTFVSDIYNDVFGDLIIDPSLLSQAMNQKLSSEQNIDLELNVEQNGLIENNINLNALSGDATVASNTSAGDATTGSANTVANVINMINSAITSGTSFLGTLNIYGSLEGDILFPQGVLETLLANNAPGNTFDAELISNREVLADINTDSSISNDVNLSANSGDAIVDSNTTAGSATTGDASTQLTILNLTNHQFIGTNALLVFVNVLGEWIGLIMDAPAGTTAAAIGSGDTTVDVEDNTALDININTDSTINNNINLNSNSGDAYVTNNTTAGNATTGDATASANIANLINTGFNLDDWFGVLFVNVFGDWFGSFGVDTLAGNPTPEPGGKAAVKDVKVFRFNPAPNQDEGFELTPVTTAVTYSGSGGSSIENDDDQEVAAATNNAHKIVAEIGQPMAEGMEQAVKSGSFMWPFFGGLTAAVLLGTERWLTWRDESKLA